MKDIPPKVLDAEKIDSLIASLEMARSVGFSSTTSPTEFLLETAIDICLLLGDAFKEGHQRRGTVINQQATEPDIYDELHNQPIVFVGPKTRGYGEDLEAALFIKEELASFFVELKNKVPFKQVYSRLFRKSYSRFRPHESIGEVAKNLSKEIFDVLPMSQSLKDLGKTAVELSSQVIKKTRAEAKMANAAAARAFRERQERRKKTNTQPR